MCVLYRLLLCVCSLSLNNENNTTTCYVMLQRLRDREWVRPKANTCFCSIGVLIHNLYSYTVRIGLHKIGCYYSVRSTTLWREIYWSSHYSVRSTAGPNSAVDGVCPVGDALGVGGIGGRAVESVQLIPQVSSAPIGNLEWRGRRHTRAVEGLVAVIGCVRLSVSGEIGVQGAPLGGLPPRAASTSREYVHVSMGQCSHSGE